ncbi:LOW QUALITY PROTEIN: Hypothetical protein PHPALM_19608 [Phytophthora palmivora]|uniref:Uncharacterized protein n=1 Tax=Phytophthora palmivora TaxID=4796 RepID=A0A2P4XGY1_9STRA|nr:LOW QUALITY PROTEIN: Hypothetical protein PHPALM_19608 [Phytophthora palmivora]
MPKKCQSDGNHHNKKPRDTVKVSERHAVKGKASSPPHKDACLICKGSHHAMEYPTATREQKDEARRTLAARPSDTGSSTGHPVTINGVLEVPLCADSGAESNILSRIMVDELCAIDSNVTLVALKPLRMVKVAGGKTISSRDRFAVDLRISTATGPLNIARVQCLALHGEEEEFPLRRATMKVFGLMPTAFWNSLQVPENDDVTEGDPELGFDNERKEIHGIPGKLVDDAVEADFEPGLAGDLRALVHEHVDVWRIRIGTDEPDRITLRAGAQPYRSGVRKYPDMQRAFLRTYVQELLDNSLFCRENNSRWACAVLSIGKAGGDGFRITVGYRPVIKLMVPQLRI